MKKKHGSQNQNMHTTSPSQGRISGTKVSTSGKSNAAHPTAGGTHPAGCAANSAYGARRMARKA